jgi:hypothetical protein
MRTVLREAAVVRRKLLVCVAAVLLAACSGPASEQSSPSEARTGHVVTLPPPERGIHLTLIQQRLDEGTDRVGLRVENVTDRTLGVREVGLDWPGYGRFTRPTESTVGPGETLDLPFLLPRERCGADVTAVPVGVAVTRSRTIRDEVDDMGVRFAERLWRTGCLARRLREAADFSYGAPWRRAGTTSSPILVTSLRVERRAGSEPITLLDTQGSVLFDVVPVGRRTVRRAAERDHLPLQITPGRCDEHARSQASQPFTFRVLLRLGDDPQVLPLVLPPDRTQQRSLLRFLDAACTSRD